LHSGPGAGWTRWFFYPGFTPLTGGLLREPDLPARQATFDKADWLARFGIARKPDETLVSLFCYEPPALPGLLQAWAAEGLGGKPLHLLVAAGRAERAVRAALSASISSEKGLQPNQDMRQLLSISYLPWMSQLDFDGLLWACDLNFVRGEDSIVRALWAGKPFVWQIYPQDDGVHSAKLDAFLDVLGAPPSWRQFHHLWNAAGTATNEAALLAAALPEWQQAASLARRRLLAQDDQTTALLRFVEKSR
jgi:uncharacterized repeat protein (TIGR03837 family)